MTSMAVVFLSRQSTDSEHWAAYDCADGIGMYCLVALRRGKSFEGECISACDNEGSCALMLAVQNGSLQVCHQSRWSHFSIDPFCDWYFQASKFCRNC